MGLTGQVAQLSILLDVILVKEVNLLTVQLNTRCFLSGCSSPPACYLLSDN